MINPLKMRAFSLTENTSRTPYVSGGEIVNDNTVTGDGGGVDGNMKEVGVHSLYDTDKEYYSIT